MLEDRSHEVGIVDGAGPVNDTPVVDRTRRDVGSNDSRYRQQASGPGDERSDEAAAQDPGSSSDENVHADGRIRLKADAKGDFFTGPGAHSRNPNLKPRAEAESRCR